MHTHNNRNLAFGGIALAVFLTAAVASASSIFSGQVSMPPRMAQPSVVYYTAGTAQCPVCAVTGQMCVGFMSNGLKCNSGLGACGACPAAPTAPVPGVPASVPLVMAGSTYCPICVIAGQANPCAGWMPISTYCTNGTGGFGMCGSCPAVAVPTPTPTPTPMPAPVLITPPPAVLVPSTKPAVPAAPVPTPTPVPAPAPPTVFPAAPASAACGNKILDAGEQCEDGNAISGDGCSATCQKEACPAPVVPAPPVVQPIPHCGNGIFDPGETCDDANNASGDGCSTTCTIESGFSCNNITAPSVCTKYAVAAVPVVKPAASTCQYSCNTSTCSGNNLPVVDAAGSASCAKPNLCQICVNMIATTGTYNKNGWCGDGLVQSGEQCDRGNYNGVQNYNNTSCSITCTIVGASPAPGYQGWCGDGIVQTGEQCDTGPANGQSYSRCKINCVLIP